MSKYEHREKEGYSEKHKKSSRYEKHERSSHDAYSSHKHNRDRRNERNSRDRDTNKRHSNDNYEQSKRKDRNNKYNDKEDKRSPIRKDSKRRRENSPISPEKDYHKKQSYGLEIPIKQEKDFDKRQSELSTNRKQRQIKTESDFSAIKNEHSNAIKQEPLSGQSRQERNERLNEAFKGPSSSNQATEPIEKEKSNLGLSGALTEDTNTYKGVVIKYNEPPEARIPKKKWRLYPFKGTEALKVLHLHRQSAYLIGRQRRVVDIAVDHPSCSKQHAVFQFRCVEEENDGQLKRKIKPYIIDLGAANGTFLNNQQIDPQRYYEMKEQDVLKFGFSSREYVLLHDKSDTTEVEDSE